MTFKETCAKSAEKFDIHNVELKGKNIIEASAGTGKTFAIANLYLRLVIEKQLPAEKILVVTFTVSATEELRSRVRKKLKYALDFVSGKCNPEEKEADVNLMLEPYKGDETVKIILLSAVNTFDEASIYTIDSLCRQLIVDNAFESGSLQNIEISSDQKKDILSIIMDFWRSRIYEGDPFFVSIILNSRVTPETLHEIYESKPVDPGVSIIPQQNNIRIDDVKKKYGSISDTYMSLRKIWFGEKKYLAELFNGLEGLKANYIDKRDMAFAEMEVFFKSETIDPFCSLPGSSDLFVPEISLKIAFIKSGKCPKNIFLDKWKSFAADMKDYLSLHKSLVNNFKHELFEYVDKRILQGKSDNNTRTFREILRDTHRAVAGPGGDIFRRVISARYRAALIDEFQDTDRLQFEIFDRVFANSEIPLFLIGDPKQAIYKFRGADIFSYIDASKAVDSKYTLDRNWRSRHELIDAVNTVFLGSSDPFINSDISFSPVLPGSEAQPAFWQGDVSCSSLDIVFPRINIEKETLQNDLLEEECFLFISEKISDILNGQYFVGTDMENRRPVLPGDIAVLVRKNYQAEKIQDMLGALGIPSVIQSGRMIFESREAEDLYHVLRAVNSPSVDYLIQTAISTLYYNYSGEEIYRLRNNEQVGEEKFTDIVRRFDEYRTQWTHSGFFSMMSLFTENEKVPGNLFQRSGGERSFTNYNHLIEILHSMEIKERLTPAEIIDRLGEYLFECPSGEDAYEIRLESDEKLVKVMTMHKSKGLEFPVVFCQFTPSSQRLRDTIKFHDPEESNRLIMSLDGAGSNERDKKLAKLEDMADELRLVYVALTRAKSKCYVVSGKNKGFSSSALGHLFFSSREGNENEKPVYENVINAILRMASESRGSIDFYHYSSVMESLSAGNMGAHNLSGMNVRKFSGPIKSGWRTWSYSSLSAENNDLERDSDSSYGTGRVDVIPLQDRTDIFSFPSGTRAGECIHEVFERADFRDEGLGEDLFIGEILLKYGFEPEWEEILSSMIKGVLRAELPGVGPLNRVSNEMRLNELQFYMPLPDREIGLLREIISKEERFGSSMLSGLREGIGLEGLLTGFIDMVFLHGDRYYIVDWKSNIIGGSALSFTAENIAHEMDQHNYHLQYYLYTLALHRYLKYRLPGYSFKENFGGVFYIFVRGFSEGSSDGVFYTMPDCETVCQMDAFFGGDEDDSCN